MVLFLRWLGQVSKPYRWVEFECYFGWVDEVEKKWRDVLVGEGRFEVLSQSGHRGTS